MRKDFENISNGSLVKIHFTKDNDPWSCTYIILDVNKQNHTMLICSLDSFVSRTYDTSSLDGYSYEMLVPG